MGLEHGCPKPHVDQSQQQAVWGGSAGVTSQQWGQKKAAAKALAELAEAGGDALPPHTPTLISTLLQVPLDGWHSYSTVRAETHNPPPPPPLSLAQKERKPDKEMIQKRFANFHVALCQLLCNAVGGSRIHGQGQTAGCHLKVHSPGELAQVVTLSC